jgi:fatty-acid desaturase
MPVTAMTPVWLYRACQKFCVNSICYKSGTRSFPNKTANWLSAIPLCFTGMARFFEALRIAE